MIASSPATNDAWELTDASAAGGCSAGVGAYKSFCVWNGSAWVASSGAGGSGITTMTTGASDPVASCAAPSTSNIALYSQTTTHHIWVCTATNTWTDYGAVGGSLAIQDNSGSSVGTGMTLKLANGTGSTWTLSCTAGICTAAPNIDTTSLVTLSTTQTITGKTVDGVTPTVFGYLDPTSSVQTQLNGKQATLSGPVTASSNIADLYSVIGDGGAKGVKAGPAIATAATASTIAERNASGEVIAANTVATGKTPMATDTAVQNSQLPTTALSGVLKYTAGVPTAIGVSSTNCVHEDGSSGVCSSGGSGSGTVNSGTAGLLTGYGATGTAVGPIPASQGNFTNSHLGGSIVAYTTTNSGSSVWFPGTVAGASAPCTTGVAGFAWPVSGYFRNVTIGITGANGAGNLRGGADVDCELLSTGKIPISRGGVIVPAKAAGGSFIQSDGLWWHENAGAAWGIGYTPQASSNTSTNVSSVAAEFIADSGIMTTVLSGAKAFATTASTTAFCGFSGSCLNTAAGAELTVATPMPFAGTLQNFAFGTAGSAPTANLVATINQNGSGGAITVTDLASDAAAGATLSDTAHTITVSAGDYISIALAPGASTQTSANSWALGLVPTTGTSFLIHGGMEVVNSTTTYFAPLSMYANATLTQASLAMPRGCTLSNLYVTLATAQTGGVTTTFTVMQNSSATTVTGTIAPAASAGAIAIDTTHTATLSAGDRISLRVSSSGGTSSVLGHWAAQCQ
jgi:hypothetical protein